jgi:glycine/D-amino acid oxidase-like deaminating enzyme
MRDLAVIGAGYWGQATADLASELGFGVDVYDSGYHDSGSRNAAAIVDPAYLRRQVFLPQEEMDLSLDWLVRRLDGVWTIEHFWNLARGDPFPLRIKATRSLYVNNSRAIGLFPVSFGPVMELRQSRMGWTVNGATYAAVVVAAGVWTGELMLGLGVSLPIGELWGRGWVVSGEPRHPVPVEVMIAPYQKYVVREWGEGLYHVGDTAEPIPNYERAKARLQRVCQAVFHEYRVEEENVGRRPTTTNGQPLISKQFPGLVVATGGRRLGLGLAHHAARRALGLLQLMPVSA